MKRCYIAGKIGDLLEQEYKANFEQGKVEVQEMGMIPVSPVDLPHNHGRTWKEYMVEDLNELTKCDHVYALNNWNNSKGARIEINLAKSLGINVIYQP